MQELDAATNETAQKALKQLQMMDLLNGKSGIGGFNQKDLGEHKFWTTQPVPQWGDAAPIGDGYIEPPKPRDQVRQDPYPLPKDFEWSFIDVGDPKQSKEVYDLLSANYVEDDDAAFRFNYSSDFLQWALRPPGYHKEWHIGVRVSSNKKLVAFISGVPMTLRVLKNTFMATEINYLCVHKKLRSKRLAPVLIKEITRQVHLKGIFQAIYTAGILIPTPISICRYFHRALNIPKLIDTKFTHVPRSMTLARMIRINKLPSTTTSTSGLREMEERDVQQVTRLFSKYMERFSMSPIFGTQEIRHQFLSGKGRGNIGDGGAGRREGQVTWAYVVEDPQSKRITDFFSFYSLPSTVINNTKHPLLEAAYLYYYASETAFTPGAEEDETLHKRLTSLLGDALVVAKEANFDVFNALTLMDNVELLRDLKFVEGDGYLNFYLYNWRTSPLSGMVAVGDVPSGKGIGVVML
ncbi:hypothetical protein AMATHDRAFT_135405 [Amanita thiersii Skay4041]|uniref:Glycylpeptide N-tetradecanoyltransferase n=1 Tax=Amanita thiersii Skay4041 TaxID=703135 RepID=A0A2A9P0Y7_9AGAR|nr:hypothetical protein AMATHDRAFT_135405 [Amanita thiersii Skay4041]